MSGNGTRKRLQREVRLLIVISALALSSSTGHVSSQLTVDRLGNPPEECQEGVLAVLVDQSPPEPWLGQLGTAERLVDYDKVGEKCTRVCELVGLDGSSAEEDCLENNVACGV